MAAIQPIADLALELANRRNIISRRVLCGDRRLITAICLNRTLLRRALRKRSLLSISLLVLFG